MFRKKYITSPSELKQFADDYKIESKGVVISLECLQQAKEVCVVYHTFRPNEFVGGYVINYVPPFRYFIAPGELAKYKALDSFHLQELELVEIGAIWLKKSTSVLRELNRVLFFAWMLKDALQTGQPYILGGSFVEPVKRLQRQVLPMIIYKNVITVGEYTGLLELYVGPRKGVWQRFTRAIAKDALARFRKRFGQKTGALKPA